MEIIPDLWKSNNSHLESVGKQSLRSRSGCRIMKPYWDYKLFPLTFFLIGILELGKTDCWEAIAVLEVWELMQI